MWTREGAIKRNEITHQSGDSIEFGKAIPRILMEILSFTGFYFDLIDYVPAGLFAGFRFARFNPYIKVNPDPSHARHWHKMYTELWLVDISIMCRMDWRYGDNHYGARWLSRSLILLFETILRY